MKKFRIVFLTTIIIGAICIPFSVVHAETAPKFNGISYGAYRGKGPGSGEIITEANVREDMQILKDIGCTHIRTYGSGLNQKIIPKIAHEYSITTFIGAWISPDHESNLAELNLAMESAVSPNDVIIVGGEVLLREELSTAALIELFSIVKNAGFMVAYSDTYNMLEENLELIDHVDILLVHVYPFWEGVAIENAANYTIGRFEELQAKKPGKEMILGEHGWPSDGRDVATLVNQKKYYEDLFPLIYEKNIKSFLFSGFDEAWKDESGVGAYWGIFTKDRRPKPAAEVVAQYFGGFVKDHPKTISGFPIGMIILCPFVSILLLVKKLNRGGP
jgi:exo-beta-1,3-glucanase (GH17 family)